MRQAWIGPPVRGSERAAAAGGGARPAAGPRRRRVRRAVDAAIFLKIFSFFSCKIN